MRPEAPLRIGLIGAGRMGAHHARAISRSGGHARLVAVGDHDAAARSRIIARWPQAQQFTRSDDVFQQADLDAVHICTPPTTHEALAEAALEAGIHVYVEKPFARSTAAAVELLALAEARGLVACAGHQLLLAEPARRALALLPALGEVVHLESYFAFRSAPRGTLARFLSPDEQLLDILPHPVCLMLRFLDAVASGERPEIAAVQVGRAGTVHVLLRQGSVCGVVVVTLGGRPVESWLRLVGTRGMVNADFVRGTVQSLVGPGTGSVDKALNPFRHGRQLIVGTAGALARRVLKAERSYPGLREAIDSFHGSILSAGPSPVSPANIVGTARVCEAVAGVLSRAYSASAPPLTAESEPVVMVTGGTGFLGSAVVRELRSAGARVVALSRRLPGAWERVDHVEYVSADLAERVPESAMSRVDVVVHCAAETAGGRREHERNTLAVTEHVLRASAQAGVRRFIHVSSLAVLTPPQPGSALDEASPLEHDGRSRGPYVWGKLESEKLARRLGLELGIAVKVVRPAAVVDWQRFEPPGALGRRVGNVFVAVGSPREPLGIVRLASAARMLAWIATWFDDAPDVVNLLEPVLPTKRELVRRLREVDPGVSVVWIPRSLLAVLSWGAIIVQELLHPSRTAVDPRRVFAKREYDTAGAVALHRRMLREQPRPAAVPDLGA